MNIKREHKRIRVDYATCDKDGDLCNECIRGHEVESCEILANILGIKFNPMLEQSCRSPLVIGYGDPWDNVTACSNFKNKKDLGEKSNV